MQVSLYIQHVHTYVHMCIHALCAYCFYTVLQHRLQKEANRQVAGLAEKAHQLALKNLDQKTKSVYRENIQLAEALSLHLKDSEEMRKVRTYIRMYLYEDGDGEVWFKGVENLRTCTTNLHVLHQHYTTSISNSMLPFSICGTIYNSL